jgi:hypothetical protein
MQIHVPDMARGGCLRDLAMAAHSVDPQVMSAGGGQGGLFMTSGRVDDTEGGKGGLFCMDAR